ncbi:hypothetical protein CPB86DRAFT_783503, partial [Serendipita vermifera]
DCDPLLPFIDESHNHLSTSFIQTLDLFCESCPAFKTWREIEKTIKSLRLVCRMWASIISNTSLNRCAFTDLYEFGYPSRDTLTLQGVERLQFASDCYSAFFDDWDDIENAVSSNIISGCIHEYFPRGEVEGRWWEHLEDEATKGLLRQARIFISPHWSLHTEKILGLMPQLQALSLYVSGYSSPPLTTIFSLLPCKSYITHLELHDLPWMEFATCFSGKQYTFPCLRTAYTNMKHDVEWNSPRLESLMISGSLNVDRESLDPLLSLWGKSVREYVDDCYFSDNQIHAIIPPFHRFPHLSLYGTRLGVVITDPIIQHRSQMVLASSPSRNPRSFLLRLEYRKYEYGPEESALRLVAYVKVYRFVEVVLTWSWARVQAMFVPYSPSGLSPEEEKWYKIFFQILFLSAMDDGG